MRVWVCNPFDLLPGEGARLQRYGLLCRSLSCAGHRVVWWSSDFCHLSKRRRASPPPGFGEVEIRLVPTRPYGRNISLARVWSHLRYAGMWRKLAEASGERPDLIVASLPPLGACEAAVAFARRVGCAVVVDLMDAWPEVFEQLVPRPFLSPFYRQAQRILDGATAVSGVGQTYLDLARSKRPTVPIHRCY
ncbi:MAG: glycosyltransferase, partial [Kiritimatiellia bacterium]